MDIVWARFKDDLKFNKPRTWFALGLRGTGKSSFLEHVAECYLAHGHSVLDLFGSRDGENLAWLRSPHVKDKRILLLKGENVDVKSSFPVKQADQLTLHDVMNYDIIISSSPLYLNIDQEFLNAAKVTDLLYRRTHWSRLVYVIVREAANFYYSRLKVSESQVFAKSQMVYLIREARHCGLSLGLDSIRYYAIDIDIRNLSDYLVLKSQGVLGLPEDLKWVYQYFNAMKLMNMPPGFFIMITKNGAIGVGSFPFPEWHKKENENLLEQLGIHVEYGEMLKEAIYRGRYQTVSDSEHAEIVRLYIEEGLSCRLIAETLKRSSRTPVEHLRSHNEAVKRSGFCPACRRAKSKFESTLAVRKANITTQNLISYHMNTTTQPT